MKTNPQINSDMVAGPKTPWPCPCSRAGQEMDGRGIRIDPLRENVLLRRRAARVRGEVESGRASWKRRD